ncbi:MAG: hypothetical protein ACON4C_08000 [Henriciella sp.]|jgi:uncharacterized membrane protein YedE/YeeE
MSLIQRGFETLETSAATLLLEVDSVLRTSALWFSGLNTAERTLGVCGFIVFLIALMVGAARRDRDPGSDLRQFSGALVLVVTVAFGLGWGFDQGPGSFSYLFGR